MQENKSKPTIKLNSDWENLLRVAEGFPLVIERVAVPERHIAVEGQFGLPQLARLSPEDQAFVIAFVRSHGSIKAMEQTFGVSYPTIKGRLKRISSQLELIQATPVHTRNEILEQLNNSEISAGEAIRALESLR